jgi:hypothetical protein
MIPARPACSWAVQAYKNLHEIRPLTDYVGLARSIRAKPDHFYERLVSRTGSASFAGIQPRKLFGRAA